MMHLRGFVIPVQIESEQAFSIWRRTRRSLAGSGAMCVVEFREATT